MSKFDPKNREEAFAYQFEDDVKLLFSLALFNKKAFQQQLAVIQTRIQAYNDKNLMKSCEKAESEHKIREQYIKDNL